MDYSKKLHAPMKRIKKHENIVVVSVRNIPGGFRMLTAQEQHRPRLKKQCKSDHDHMSGANYHHFDAALSLFLFSSFSHKASHEEEKFR